jgi:hypothetical protein
VLWGAESPKGFDDLVDAFATLSRWRAVPPPSWSRVLAIGEVTATRLPVGLNQLERLAHIRTLLPPVMTPVPPASCCSPGTDSPANCWLRRPSSMISS